MNTDLTKPIFTDHGQQLDVILSILQLRVGFRDVNERLHGLELKHDQQNSST